MSRMHFRILIGVLITTPLIGGCATAPEPTAEELEAMQPRYNSSGSVILDGRPVDLEASVRFVAGNASMAVVSTSSPNAWEREYELVSATDEPGWLLVRTPDSSPLSLWDQSVTRLVAHAKIGRFGNPDAEQELLRMLNERLEELAGE